MLIRVIRFSGSADDTLSLVFIDGQFYVFGLEDERRVVKVAGETAIPAGKYRVRLRTEGGFHNRYSKRFKHFHVGMLEICNVPGFTHVLVHPGNTDEDTDGCLLVGNGCYTNLDGSGELLDSVKGYKEFYKVVSKALLSDEDVFIQILDKVTS
jgi:hypothetical protein